MSHTTRILVTGGDGILAQALIPYFPLGTFLSKDECDVTNANQVRAAFNAVKPEMVIHCAAVTAHDAEPFAYVMGNVLGTIQVALGAKKTCARFVYPSTDYLQARLESDPVRPVNAYAASKYCGELIARSITPGLVVRGSWYSGPTHTHAATDAFSSKVPVEKAAYWIAMLSTSSLTGTINIGGVRRSLYEIAIEHNERVVPVSRHQIRCGYEIPADASLDTQKLTRFLAG